MRFQKCPAGGESSFKINVGLALTRSLQAMKRIRPAQGIAPNYRRPSLCVPLCNVSYRFDRQTRTSKQRFITSLGETVTG